MFYTAEKKELPLDNVFKGKSCFITAGGPSLAKVDHALLKQPGIVTFGCNNSPKVFRPNIWTHVDSPESFLQSIWKDPVILKIAAHRKARSTIFDNNAMTKLNIMVKDCPNTIFYDRNAVFNAETYIDEPTVNWGSGKKHGGTRSVFLAVVKMCYMLGFNKVFLLGCDFKMVEGQQNYAWNQDRSPGSINNNNSTYRVLNERFTLLRPKFEEKGFYIFNCTKNSGLKVFPFMDLKDALQIALRDFPDTKTENASGLYDRKAKEQEELNKKKVG